MGLLLRECCSNTNHSEHIQITGCRVMGNSSFVDSLPQFLSTGLSRLQGLLIVLMSSHYMDEPQRRYGGRAKHPLGTLTSTTTNFPPCPLRTSHSYCHKTETNAKIEPHLPCYIGNKFIHCEQMCPIVQGLATSGAFRPYARRPSSTRREAFTDMEGGLHRLR